MMFHQLIAKISVIAPDIEYILYPAGIQGLFHLGEAEVCGLHLIDATPEEIIEFIEGRE